MVGQKIYGKNMMLSDQISYDYLIKRFNRKTHRNLIDRTLNHLMAFFEVGNLNILCSWFCERDVFLLKKMGYNLENCYFYDFDETVHEKNLQYSDNCMMKDVIFDDIPMKGVKIHRYCEYTFPIGRIYDGEFILTGCDDDSLHICNPIKSVDQLIEQNQIKDVYHFESWECKREFDRKKINYYMVIGCK